MQPPSEANRHTCACKQHENMQYLVDALFNIKLLHLKRLHDVAMNFTCEGNNSYSLRKDHRQSGYVDRQILSRNAEIQNPYLQHFQSARSLQSPQRNSKEDRSSDTHRIFRKLSVQAIQRNTRHAFWCISKTDYFAYWCVLHRNRKPFALYQILCNMIPVEYGLFLTLCLTNF